MPGATPILALPYPLLTDAADIEDFGVKDLAVALDALINAMGTRYETIRDRQALLNAGKPSVTRLFYGNIGSDVNNGMSGAGISAGVGPAAFYLDPAAYPSGGRALKLRVSGVGATGSTAPGCDFTFALYPVTPATGTSSTSEVALGTIVSGSSCTISAPGANGLSHAESLDFAFPTAGFYALTVLNSATIAANGHVDLTITLAFRAV